MLVNGSDRVQLREILLSLFTRSITYLLPNYPTRYLSTYLPTYLPKFIVNLISTNRAYLRAFQFHISREKSFLLSLFCFVFLLNNWQRFIYLL